MSLWWVQKNQLDDHQVRLIESLPLRENALIVGPPGSGKTNVLLRRAQFVRSQNMPNVLVLSFTRPLTEFVKTGCYDASNREIFPPTLVSTIETWLRKLYDRHDELRPPDTGPFLEYRRRIAAGAVALAARGRQPQYDALFVDEAQDLVKEEVEALAAWSRVLFFVGDDRQRIYDHGHADGLAAVGTTVDAAQLQHLPFHYRVARQICQVADRIFIPTGGESLASTCHYNGPTPAVARKQPQGELRPTQLVSAATRLALQVRVYADLIRQGDRVGVIVARKDDRAVVLDHLEADPLLNGKAQIVRARESREDDHVPAFDPDKPICILTVKGCKGLEFRAVHWLFAEQLSHHHRPEDYYTVVTRAKTSLDVYYTTALPDILVRSIPEDTPPSW